MSSDCSNASERSNFPAGRAIFCIVPDDGTDKRVLNKLRNRFGVVRGRSLTCRGVGALAEHKNRRGILPEAELVRQLCVICSDEQVDEIFDFIFWTAQFDKPGRGIMWQQSAFGCTSFQLPPGIPDE